MCGSAMPKSPHRVLVSGVSDVRIRAHSHSGGRQRSQPEFCLENKLGALLTEEQIKQDVDDGVKHLVAVTKHYPDVTPERIRELGAQALRWQDFHRALSALGHRSAVERKLALLFADYLEEMDMAHRASPGLKEIAACRRVLKVATADQYDRTGPRRAFRTFDELLMLLEDAYIRFVARNPRFGSWAPRFGPGFWRWVKKSGRYHVVGWILNRAKGDSPRLECAVAFPDNPKRPVQLWVQTVLYPP